MERRGELRQVVGVRPRVRGRRVVVRLVVRDEAVGAGGGRELHELRDGARGVAAEDGGRRGGDGHQRRPGAVCSTRTRLERNGGGGAGARLRQDLQAGSSSCPTPSTSWCADINLLFSAVILVGTPSHQWTRPAAGPAWSRGGRRDQRQHHAAASGRSRRVAERRRASCECEDVPRRSSFILGAVLLAYAPEYLLLRIPRSLSSSQSWRLRYRCRACDRHNRVSRGRCSTTSTAPSGQAGGVQPSIRRASGASSRACRYAIRAADVAPESGLTWLASRC